MKLESKILRKLTNHNINFTIKLVVLLLLCYFLVEQHSKNSSEFYLNNRTKTINLAYPIIK